MVPVLVCATELITFDITDSFFYGAAEELQINYVKKGNFTDSLVGQICCGGVLRLLAYLYISAIDVII